MWIRAAREDDTAVIAAFNRAMAHETEHLELPESRVLAGVQGLLQRPDYGRYYLAEIDGQIAGQTMITFEWSDWRNGVFWWLQSVYVHPDFRRAGVFKALYRHIEQEARADNTCCGLRLYVEESNGKAQQTYAALGMTPRDYRLFEVDFTADAAGSTQI